MNKLKEMAALIAGLPKRILTTRHAKDRMSFQKAIDVRGGMIEARYVFTDRVIHRKLSTHLFPGYWVKVIYWAQHPDGIATRFEERTWIAATDTFKTGFSWEMIHEHQLSKAQQFLEALSGLTISFAWRLKDFNGEVVAEQKLEEVDTSPDLPSAYSVLTA